MKVRRQAAFAVGKMLSSLTSHRGGASIKTLTLAPNIIAKKATYAVSCQTLKYLNVIRQVVEETRLLEKNPKLRPELAYVLVYEALMGDGPVEDSKGDPEQWVAASHNALRAALARAVKAAGVSSPEGLLPPALSSSGEGANRHPRYARVNTLKMSVEEVLAWLRSPPKTPSRAMAEAAKQVKVDDLLPDLLVFPPGTDLHDHVLVKSGVLLQQGKASCMPAHALAPGEGWHVLDACSAPGNKTTHVAALLRGAGKVTACEKCPRRIKTLRNTVAAAGAERVETRRCDFLKLDPHDPAFQDVQGILLDPSCSGSGTAVTRMDHLTAHLPEAAEEAGGGEGGGGEGGEGSEEERVEKLATFQETALRHALRFPALRRISYSTCSVHDRENEGVVMRVLGEAEERGFRLEAPFPGWPHRGRPLFEGAECLVRTDAGRDRTDGFFVALFVRDDPSAYQEPEATGAAGAAPAVASAGDGAGVSAVGGGSKAKGKKRKAPAGGGDQSTGRPAPPGGPRGGGGKKRKWKPRPIV